MSTEHPHPLEPAGRAAAVRWGFRSFLEKRIAQAEAKPLKHGIPGALGALRLAGLRFFLGLVETLIFAVLSPAVGYVLWSYFSASSDALWLKLYSLAGCLSLLAWTWTASVRSRDRDSLGKILIDFGKLLKGERITESTQAYQYLLAQYRQGRCSESDNPLKTIAATHKCESKPTSSIQEYYSDRRKTAADWLCVISAKKGTTFLQSKNFGKWLAYFHGFDHSKQPTDRIVRLFSTPVAFPEESIGPAWGEANYALDEDERFMLLAYLFMNRAVGVETKLHCFDPTRDTNTPFFQEADYVLVFDPASDNDENCETLFIAAPGAAQTCWRLKGRSIWTETFRFEFYNRLTYGHKHTRECDSIDDVASASASEVAGRLQLANLNSRWPEVSDSLKKYNPNFASNELDKLAARWNKWFPA